MFGSYKKSRTKRTLPNSTNNSYKSKDIKSLDISEIDRDDFPYSLFFIGWYFWNHLLEGSVPGYECIQKDPVHRTSGNAQPHTPL